MPKQATTTSRASPKPVHPLKVDRQEATVALSRAPEEVRTFADTHKVAVRDVVHSVYGRNDEVERLAGYVERSANEADPGNALPGITVMAAPGAGKTVLVGHLQEELRAKGIGVVEATPEQLTSPEGFKEAILEAEPWRRRENITKALKTVRDVLARVGDTTANTTATLTFGSQGMVVPYLELNIIEGILQKLDRNETPTVRETLKLLNHSATKGSVVVVDEAQSLIDYAKGTPQGECAANIIRTLANVKPRTKAGIPKVTIMMFGTGDTRDVVGDLGSYDPVDERLRPLNREMVEHVIRDHVRLGAQGDRGLFIRACDLWVTPLVNEYSDWTRHAAGAARSCEAMLKEYNWQAVDEDWGWPALLRLADRTRNRVYERMGEDADRNGVNPTLQHTVLQALIRQPEGRLAKEMLHDLVRSTIDRIYGAGTAAKPYGNTKHSMETMMVRGLRRAGMIDDVLTATGEATGYVHAPVPSTRAFAGAYPPANLDEVLEHIREVGLPTDTPPANGTGS